MRTVPILIGAIIITPILGAVTGASIDTTMKRQSDDANSSKSSGSIGGAQDSGIARIDSAQSHEDSFAMDTPDGRIELAELSTYGADRERRDAALEFDEQAIDPLSDSEIDRITAEALAPLPSYSSSHIDRASRDAAIAAADDARSAIAMSRQRNNRSHASENAQRYPAQSEPAQHDLHQANPAIDPIY